MFDLRISRVSPILVGKSWISIVITAVATLATAAIGYAQQSYTIGDFESVSTIIGQSNGPTFTATAADPPHVDTNGNYLGMWSDAGDIQRQYFGTDLYDQSLTAEGATHGSTAILTNAIPPDGGYHHILQLDSSGNSPTTAALIHASAMKFDVTFDPAQLPVASTSNTYAFFLAVIQTRAGYVQGKPSYDSFSVMDSTGAVTNQPNYDAGQYNPADTTDYPAGAKKTITVTIDFTKDRQNAGSGDTFDPPTWNTYHNQMVTDYNTDAGANDYSNIHILFDAGSGFSAAGVYVDNIRLIEPGDFNQDGSVTTADIQAGINALANMSSYESANNMKPYDMNLIGDVNGDGKVDNTDIQALISKLATSGGGGSLSVVPEPSTLLLFGFGAAAFGGLVLRAKSQRRAAVGLRSK